MIRTEGLVLIDFLFCFNEKGKEVIFYILEEIQFFNLFSC